MTQEQKTAVFKLTLESLTKDREEWMPWILELQPEQMRRLLVAILGDPVLGAQIPEPLRDRILILLGTYATNMTAQWVVRWAPEIMMAANRKLAARMPLPPE